MTIQPDRAPSEAVEDARKMREHCKARIERVQSVASFLAKVGIFGDPEKPTTLTEPGPFSADLIALLVSLDLYEKAFDDLLAQPPLTEDAPAQLESANKRETLLESALILCKKWFNEADIGEEVETHGEMVEMINAALYPKEQP